MSLLFEFTNPKNQKMKKKVLNIDVNQHES